MAPHSKKGFTLVELLVVITIIVILLALLTPALDKAIYQAELAACGARLDGIATGVIGYASGSNRAYPYRQTLDPAFSSLQRPSQVKSGAADDRPWLRLALGGLDILNDPLCAKMDLNRSPTYLSGHYNLWFGMSFLPSIGGGKGMRRIGDKLEWLDKSRGRNQQNQFRVLASDIDWLMPVYTSQTQISDQHVISSHVDFKGVMYLQKIVNHPDYELTWWTHSETHERGTLETNFAMTDGSVARFDKVAWNDDRMARVPISAPSSDSEVEAGLWMHLPPQP